MWSTKVRLSVFILMTETLPLLTCIYNANCTLGIEFVWMCWHTWILSILCYSACWKCTFIIGCINCDMSSMAQMNVHVQYDYSSAFSHEYCFWYTHIQGSFWGVKWIGNFKQLCNRKENDNFSILLYVSSFKFVRLTKVCTVVLLEFCIITSWI
jgi:hypothetical protein